MSGLEFETELVRHRNAVRLCVPPELAARVGDERLVPATVTINDVPIATTLHKLSGGFMMAVNKDVQERVGVSAGDLVRVVIERDESERTANIPADLAAALAESSTQDAFDRLTLFRRNEIVTSVEAARRPDTRARRIADAVAALR